jgi:signal transduction histidine kinase/ligand-binding sensor domain-containing protein
MRIFIAPFFVLCISILKAQTPPATAFYYSASNGLADNDVQSILQDSRGFIWIGTREGLSRYDGTGFKNFFAEKNNPAALPNNYVTGLQEYKPGHLLFNCNGLLVCLNIYTEQFYRPPSFANKLISGVQKKNGNHIIVTGTDSCYILNENLEIIGKVIPPFQRKNRGMIIVELNDTSWLATNDAENFIYNTFTKQYTPLVVKSNVRPDQQYFHPFFYDAKSRCIYFGNFWDGIHKVTLAGHELYHWDANTTNRVLKGGGVTFIKQKNDSLLWIGTNGFGLYQLNTRNNEIVELLTEKKGAISLMDNRVTDYYTDRDGNEWIASRKGITKLNWPSKTINSWQHELIINNQQLTPLNLVKGDPGQLYLSIYNGNIFYKINTAHNKITQFLNNPIPATWYLNSWGNDLMFTGWGTRVTRFNTSTHQFIQYDFLKKYFTTSELVILAFKHSNGDEWFSGNNGGGFVRVDARDGSIHSYKKDGPRGKFSHNYYATYAEDKNGDLWFGVNKSEKLVKWTKATDQFHEILFDTVQGTKGESFSGISELTVDKANNLWIAFDGSGLVKYNIAENKSTHYSLENGLPTNAVYALEFDNKNRLWIGTVKGLSCFIIDENKFVSFTKEDGLPDDYFDDGCSYYDSSANKLWIASSTTLMSFVPDELLMQNKKPFPVYIDEIFVNSKRYTKDKFDEINFRPLKNNLQFSFIALDLNNAKDIEYSYKLDGVDDDWVYNYNNNTASYARLNPGNYKFSVRAKHKGDNEWVMMNKPLTFTIQTPWFKTLWFRLLAVAVVSFLVWLIIRAYYLTKLEKEKVVSEKKQAIEQERTRIATDMHDDFGASLSRIKFISEKMQLSKYGDEHLKHDLTKISTYSDEMAEKMNEIVWALNQRYDSLEDLISFSRAYAADYLEHHNIHLLFRDKHIVNKELKGEIRRNIFMMIKESLHNIVKHASATEVLIEFIQGDQLFIRIKDNGKGFAEENIRPFANGLENMKKRLKDIGGSFTIKHEDGTLVEASVHI